MRGNQRTAWFDGVGLAGNCAKTGEAKARVIAKTIRNIGKNLTADAETAKPDCCNKQ